MVEEGVPDLDDVLRARIADLELGRERAKASLDRELSAHRRPIEIGPATAQSFGRTMRENVTTGETPFGKFLDRPTTIELQNDIVAVDLKGLESYPDLQGVCLYIITDLVWREVQRDRSRIEGAFLHCEGFQ